MQAQAGIRAHRNVNLLSGHFDKLSVNLPELFLFAFANKHCIFKQAFVS